jgi:surfeit locus 1 family protein
MKMFQAIRRIRLLSINIAGFHFNPGLISTIVTMVMLYTMISLGFWQLDRYAFKINLKNQLEQRKSLPAASDLSLLPKPQESRRYYPVRITGHYESGRSFLLDNKVYQGQPGYHVYTPFITTSGTELLVNRGFVPLGRTRKDLPDASVTENITEISGLLNFPPSRTIELGTYKIDYHHWPVVVQHIDLTEISQVLHQPVYDMVLWLNQDQAGIKQYDLPVLNLKIAMHKGYAFQWFAMSTALVIIYFVVNTKRINKQ